jgi:hypothetical protein
MEELGARLRFGLAKCFVARKNQTQVSQFDNIVLHDSEFEQFMKSTT